jgi:hypothetical protein
VKALDPAPIVTMTEETVSFSDAVSTTADSSEISGGDPVSAIVTEPGLESAEAERKPETEKESDSPAVLVSDSPKDEPEIECDKSVDCRTLKEIELQDALDAMALKVAELSERAARAEAGEQRANMVCAALSARVIQRGGVQ